MTTAPSADADFRAVFDAHHRDLHAYCLRRLGVHDANEATADVLLAAWRHLDEVPREAVRPWLLRIARRAVEARRRGLNQVRVVARDGVSVRATSGGGGIQLIRHPAVESIHRALAELRDAERETVQLALWEGLTEDEIAGTVGVPIRAVERRLHRALSRVVARDTVADRATEGFTIAERVRAADPIPSTESFPPGALSSGALLALVDDRHAPAGPLAPLELERPAGNGRGLLLAALVATVGVVAVVFVVVGLVGPPERRAPTTTTPPSTVAAVTTVAPLPTFDPLALTADTPPLEVVETMYDRWSRADIGGYRALIDDATAGYNLASFDHAAWYRLLSGVVDIRTCSSEAPGVVHCATSYYSGLAHGQELFREEAEFTVEDGRIVQIDPLEQLGLFNVGYDRDGFVGYRNWVLDNQPEGFDDLFAFGTSILLHTPELRDAHSDLMERYRAETGPTGPLREARPIKVVDTYYGHLRTADLESARELVAVVSADAVDLVPTDHEVWYHDVTGIAAGRICDTLSPIQVRCDVTYYSGLAPGTELTGRILLYTVVDGRIVDIEALGPVESVVTADESALAGYRAWLFIADPFAVVEFFTEGGTLVLDTDEARAAHRRYKAQYLEELAG